MTVGGPAGADHATRMDRVPARAPSAIDRQMGDEVVLLSTDTEHYYSLNPVGARVWSLVDGVRDVAAIVQALGREYAVDEATLRADIDELLADLERHRLIRWAER